MRRRFKADPKWITVRHPARCAEPNCQTQINSGERGFYYPGDNSLYGSRCGHGEKAERDLPHTGSTKTATKHNERTNGGFYHVNQ
jgi:hypothetical protein